VGRQGNPALDDPRKLSEYVWKGLDNVQQMTAYSKCTPFLIWWFMAKGGCKIIKLRGRVVSPAVFLWTMQIDKYDYAKTAPK
jgi:hypothetical protein